MIQKQNININFAKGLDTKTDPWQVAPDNFLVLKNQVFTTGDRLTKRNGFQTLTTLPNKSSSYLTTLNDNLTTIGDSIYAYNASSATWVTKGNIQPMEVHTLPLIRNNFNQIQCDAAISPNGLVCTAYTENGGSDGIRYLYAVADSVTGQNIIPPTLISSTIFSGDVAGSLRVFVLGNYFVILFPRNFLGTDYLSYFSISSTTPSAGLVGTGDITSGFVGTDAESYDGVVVGSTLFVGFNTATGGQAVQIAALPLSSATLGEDPGAPATYAGYTATHMSMCADTTTTTPYIYASFYDSGSSTSYTLAVDPFLSPLVIPTATPNGGSVVNITSAAQNNACNVYFENNAFYGYDSAIPTNFISMSQVYSSGAPVSFKSIFSNAAPSIVASSASGLVHGMSLVDVTTPGNLQNQTEIATLVGTTITLSHITTGASASSPGDTIMAQFADFTSNEVIIRSVGLASKAFIVNGTIYFLAEYLSAYQPTYFLINASLSTQDSPVIAGKLAYGNGGTVDISANTLGYLPLGLPSVSLVNANVANIPYLNKDLIAAVNKGTNLASGTQTAGIYSQTGINFGTFTIGTQYIDTSEIGNDLLISGGFLWMYDGYLPVEHNFFLWPDNVEATKQADPAPTGTVSNSVTPNTMTAVSDVTGITVGMTITGTDVPSGTTVIAVGTTTITMSANATGASTGTYTFKGTQTAQPYYYQVTYEWTDNQGNAYRSAPSIPVTATTVSGHSSVVINIPCLRLTYKTANPVKIVIYRWSAAQPVYYQLTSITQPIVNSTNNDSVAYIDAQTDASILGNNIIYTNGGVVEDINAPASNVLTLFDTRFWLLDAEDPNLWWYSKQVIENTPVEMSDLFTYYIPPNTGAQGSLGPITAGAPMDDKLISFHASGIVYINGSGPDNTGANSQYSQPIFITSTVGCNNQRSIVLTPSGLMFQSDGKGIWLLGRDLSTQYIGSAVEAFNGSIVQSAVNIPTENQVRFTLNTGEMLVYDYFYGQWSTFVGAPAISSCVYKGLHTILNSTGQVYQESVGSYLDGNNPVLIGLTSAWFNLSGLQGYQRAFFFYLLGQYITPHKLQLSIAYDYNPAPTQTSLIAPTNFAGFLGGTTLESIEGTNPDNPLGQSQYYGGTKDGALERWRIFLTKQRCQAFQISIQEIYDASFGVPPGEGLTLSGINLVFGSKKGFRPTSARHTVGGGTA